MRHIIFDIFDWIDTVMIVKMKIVKIFDFVEEEAEG